MLSWLALCQACHPFGTPACFGYIEKPREGWWCPTFTGGGRSESVCLAKPGEMVAVDPGRGLGPTYMSNQEVSTWGARWEAGDTDQQRASGARNPGVQQRQGAEVGSQGTHPWDVPLSPSERGHGDFSPEDRIPAPTNKHQSNADMQLRTIAETWKWPRCPSTEEWIKKMWSIYTMECYSAIQKNEIMPFAATWIDLEMTMLSKVNQRKNENHMISLICGI